MSTAPELIRSEIQRRTDDANAVFQYDKGSGSYEDLLHEQEMELRGSYEYDAEGVEAWSDCRHYEVKPVVAQLGGHWVCWLYWYGGGKHGDPGSIDWVEDAILVEEGEPIIQPTFRKVGAA